MRSAPRTNCLTSLTARLCGDLEGLDESGTGSGLACRRAAGCVSYLRADLDSDLDSDFDLDYDCVQHVDFGVDFGVDFDLDSDCVQHVDFDLEFDFGVDFDLEFDFGVDFDLDSDCVQCVDFDLDSYSVQCVDFDLDSFLIVSSLLIFCSRGSSPDVHLFSEDFFPELFATPDLHPGPSLDLDSDLGL
ncbi:MAG: hypothetical protein KVP17_004242 [Porospora cf. gigantea B]|uniref:uncharacterized protein n=1 Tax=Porospora cf. gigantea B TaxID=2853592 RepID=UPI003571E2B0|nr:MAG: hypothetical protein KVP17_004242 [Porospora cf. gigantea B]